MCDADVYAGIRLRETGHSADASGFWAFLGSQLVRRQCYLRENPLMRPEFILSDPKASNGSRSWGSLTRIHYSEMLSIDQVRERNQGT